MLPKSFLDGEVIESSLHVSGMEVSVSVPSSEVGEDVEIELIITFHNITKLQTLYNF